MRELAYFESSAACRIKIQFIEFLCEISPPLQICDFAKGGTSLAPPVFSTGGAQIGEMAEDSQICDFGKYST